MPSLPPELPVRGLRSFQGVRLKSWVCRGCSSRESLEKYAEKRVYIGAIKLAAGCADCGYDTSPYGLEFDHRPGTPKVDKISNPAGVGACLWS